MKYLLCVFVLFFALLTVKPNAQVGTNHYYAWVAATATVGETVHQYTVTDYDSNGTRTTYIAEWDFGTGAGYGTSNPATAKQVTLRQTTATSAHYKGVLFSGSGGKVTPSNKPFTLDITKNGDGSWTIHFRVTDSKGTVLVDNTDIVTDPPNTVKLST